MNADAAAQVLPGYELGITVTSITAGSATAAIEIVAEEGGAYVWLSIDDGAGVEVAGTYMTVKNGGAPTAPAPTTTGAVAASTQWYSASALRGVSFRSGDQIRLFVPGAGTKYVRQHRSSP